MKIRVYCHTAVCIIRKHLLQYIAIAFVIGIFCSPFAILRIVKSCLSYTQEQIRLDTYGHFSGISVDVQEKEPDKERLSQADAGLIRVCGSIPSPTYGAPIQVGSIDDPAANMLNIQIKDGRSPQNENEIAIVYEDYIRLDQLVPIGDKIRFTMITIDGTPVEKEYILCGILYDHSEKWNAAFGSTGEAALPTALVTGIGNESVSACVLYGERYLHMTNPIPTEWFGGKYYQNYFLLNQSISEKETSRIYDVILLIAQIIFAIVLYFGCRSVTSALQNFNAKTTQLLRYVGVSSSGIYFIFLFVSFCFIAPGLAVGLITGGMLSFLSVTALRYMGVQIDHTFAFSDYFAAAVIIFVLLTGIFSLQIFLELHHKEYHSKKHKMRSENKKKEYSSCFELYRKTIGKNKNRRMRFQTILFSTTACIFMSAVFLSKVIADVYMADIITESGMIQSDYAFLPTSGSRIPEYLNLEQIRDYGLTKDQLVEIDSGADIKISLSMTGDYASAFLYYNSEQAPPPYSEEILEKFSLRKQFSNFRILDGNEIFRKYGFEENEDLLDHPVYGIPFDQLSQYCEFDGNIDEEAFNTGTEAVAYQSPDSDARFHVGDEIELYIYEFDPIIENNKTYTPRLTKKKMRISAVYTPDDTDILGQYLKRTSAYTGCLLISDQILIEADRELKYSTVLVDQVNEKADVQAVENELLEIYQHCRHGKYVFRNYANITAQLNSNIKKYESPFLCLLGILILILLISYVFSSVVYYTIHARTDHLLIAVGIRERVQRSYSCFNDLLRNAKTIAVTFFYEALLAAFCSGILSIPLSASFLFSVFMKTIIFVSAASIILSVLGDLAYSSWLRKQDIVKGLHQDT